MANALSVDPRERVVAAVSDGLSRRSAAARFGVSVSSAVRWVELSLDFRHRTERTAYRAGR
jgi:transposase